MGAAAAAFRADCFGRKADEVVTARVARIRVAISLRVAAFKEDRAGDQRNVQVPQREDDAIDPAETGDRPMKMPEPPSPAIEGRILIDAPLINKRDGLGHHSERARIEARVYVQPAEFKARLECSKAADEIEAN